MVRLLAGGAGRGWRRGTVGGDPRGAGRWNRPWSAETAVGKDCIEPAGAPAGGLDDEPADSAVRPGGADHHDHRADQPAARPAARRRRHRPPAGPSTVDRHRLGQLGSPPPAGPRQPTASHPPRRNPPPGPGTTPSSPSAGHQPRRTSRHHPRPGSRTAQPTRHRPRSAPHTPSCRFPMPDAAAATPLSPNSPAPARSRPPAAKPPATGSIGVGTER